ncbi:MAG: hypothetical protein HYY57_01055, partial [Candidatus Omnitrophica bacterium]|nr:hypothetical protein [Candidatus Omnitrophota bacterium]
RRTVGVNYVLADAKSKRAVAVETTHRYARVFTANDPAEQAVPYAKPLVHAIVRADVAMDPMIRERQIAAHGNPYRDGLEDPSGSSSYDVRYCKFADGLLALEGNLDPRSAMDLARAVAPPSNVQSVVFAWPDVWVANAQGSTPAAQTPYYHLDVQELLK